MSILIDVIPDTVEIEGIEYVINSNFRNSILFELTMQDSSLLEEEKLYNSLNLYYPTIPSNLKLAVEEMLWFYKCGRVDYSSNESLSTTNSSIRKIYSYEHDDDYIYSAFLDQYGIDLQDVDHLHWWKFRALFKGLKEDNLISKIMGYRSIEISNDMSDSEKNYYRKMKEIYALPDLRTDEEKEKDFNICLSSMF